MHCCFGGHGRPGADQPSPGEPDRGAGFPWKPLVVAVGLSMLVGRE